MAGTLNNFTDETILKNPKISLLLQVLTLALPINIYVVGDWLGTGVQWVLFRYQRTYLGISLIPITRDLEYVLSGIMAGRSGTALLLWCGGAIILTTAILLTFYWCYIDSEFSIGPYAPLLTILSGILFGISCIEQYGIFFAGSAGFTIPIGIPLLIGLGWWIYQKNTDQFLPTKDYEKDNDD